MRVRGWGRRAGGLAVALGLVALVAPSSAGAVDVIQDGSFEAANGSSSPFWSETDTAGLGGPSYSCGGMFSVAFPRTGIRCAEFVGVSGANRTAGIEQTVNLVTGSATLTFYARVGVGSPPTVNPADRMRARVDGVVVTEIGPSSLTSNYARFDANVSAFADGAQHVVRIEGFVNDGSNVAYTVDDVSLDSVAAGSVPGDTAAPQTTITKRPKNKTKKKKAKFEFTSSEPGSTFLCGFDGAPLTPCASPRGGEGKEGQARVRCSGRGLGGQQGRHARGGRLEGEEEEVAAIVCLAKSGCQAPLLGNPWVVARDESGPRYVSVLSMLATGRPPGRRLGRPGVGSAAGRLGGLVDGVGDDRRSARRRISRP